MQGALALQPNYDDARRLLGQVLAKQGRIDDAVAAVEHPSVQELADRGAKLFVCAYGCQKRRLPLSDRATNCGLVVLGDLINGTDRFISLN